jgi:tRNA-dependent cyclodipeptide synthase
MRTANLPLNNTIPNNLVLNTYNETVEVLDSIAIYEHICEKTKHKRVLTLNLLGTTPAHLKGWELVKKRELITVGMSIGNGYFTRERVEVILIGMASYFREVVVIVPDLPVLHTYRALGYDERDALDKMKKHKQTIERHCRHVSEQIKLELGLENIRIVMWSDGFAGEKDYQLAYDKAVDIFHSNIDFREAILRNTERYILARLENSDVQQLGGMRKIVETASHYVNGGYNNSPNKSVGCVTYNIIM